ncbi:MAG: MBL fold metallo-hydrolase [Bacillota bacterium]
MSAKNKEKNKKSTKANKGNELLPGIIISAVLVVIAVTAVILGSSYGQNAGLNEVAEGVYVSVGPQSNVNATLIVSGKEAVLVDTGESIEQANDILNFLEKKKITLKGIVITQDMPEHTAGITVLMGHEVYVYNADIVKNGHTIKLGDLNIKLIETPRFSGDRHISAEIIEKKILIAGDVVNSEESVKDEVSVDKATMESTLNNIIDGNYSIIIPGHGETIKDINIVKSQLDALRK